MMPDEILNRYLELFPYRIGKHRTNAAEAAEIIYTQVCQTTAFELYLEQHWDEFGLDVTDDEMSETRRRLADMHYSNQRSFYTRPHLPQHYAWATGHAYAASSENRVVNAVRVRAWLRKNRRKLKQAAEAYAAAAIAERTAGAADSSEVPF